MQSDPGPRTQFMGERLSAPPSHWRKRKAEGLGEAALSDFGNTDRAAVAQPADPAELEAARSQRGAKRAGKMRASLAPIETGAAEGAALPSGIIEVEAEAGQYLAALARHLAAILAEHDAALGDQRIRKRHAKPSREMVIAGPRPPQRVVELRRRAMARRPDRGHRHHRLEHAADQRRGKPVITMPPLFLQRQQPRLRQLGEMAARRLRRYPGDIGELRGGLRPPVLEPAAAVGAGGIADERGDGGEIDWRAHALEVVVIAERIQRR